MKKTLCFLLGLLLVCSIYQACAPEELPGSIYGTVVDKATGEPIKSAGVTLTPNGSTTVTGSDGHFEFTSDHKTCNLPESTTIVIKMAQFSLKRVRLNKSNFIQALTDKLYWGEDVRNIR